MYYLRTMLILVLCAFALHSCSVTNKLGHMLNDATEEKEQKGQSTTKEKKDDNFISAPGLSPVQIDELWAVAINTCYRLNYSVTFNDRKSNNIACQTETSGGKSTYTMRVRFSDKGILVDVKSNSMANLLFGSAATKHDAQIMRRSLEDKLGEIYTAKKDYNRSKTMIYKVQKQLTELNYDPGPSDGVMGRKTTSAIRSFQQDNNIQPTGKLDEETLQKLNSMSKK